MTTAIEPTSSSPTQSLERSAPPRPKLSHQGDVPPRKHGFTPSVPIDGSAGQRGEGIPTSLEALQRLKQTRPPPPRRQSAPVPGGILPLPSIDKPEASASKQPPPHLHRSFPGKPPPPTTQPPLATLEAARRHSTGNVGKKGIPDSIMRPSPPRGPSPGHVPGGSLAGIPAATTASNAVTMSSGSQLEEVRRRSSAFSRPPPGRPPPSRRLSVGQPRSSFVPQGAQSQVPQERTQEERVPESPDDGVSTSNTKVLQRGSEGRASRRVSFSAYGDPFLETEQKRAESGPRVASMGGECEEQGRTQVGHDLVSPLPQVQQQQQQHRRSSQLSIARRSPPPRPVGDPPGDPDGEFRRYSIFNEISKGSGDFSRRMSTMESPKAINDSSRAAESASTEGSERIVSGAATRSSFSGPPDKHIPPPQSAIEARATMLRYNMGVTKQKEQDLVGAVECYMRAANEGHPKAQHNLAAIFEKGAPGVPKDDSQAVRLFQLAADQGLAESCYSLAMHFKFGLGVEQDDGRCVYYLEKASEQGLAKAMFNLGLMYEKHRGVSTDASEPDLLEATRECYQAAAEAGVTKAAVNLGVMHLTGRIAGGNPAEAPEWFKLAADQGDLSGLWNLSLCYERGAGVSKDPIAAQALKHQCRELERRRSTSGAGLGGAEAIPATQRRSSDPGSSAKTSPSPISGKEKHESEGDSLHHPRQRSTSVPRLTPPPPRGPPPRGPPPRGPPPRGLSTRVPSPRGPPPQQRGIDISSNNPLGPGTGNDETDVERTLIGYKFVPDAKTGVKKEPISDLGGADVAMDHRASLGTTGNVAQNTSAVDPQFQSERKDSLSLKPTPTAIARVKAAVERRRALEAEASPSAAREN